MKKIILTGGGTAGHVTPNLALIGELQKRGWEIAYIGSQTGIEKELIDKVDVTYHAIAVGKLRRQFSLKNFLDPFKVFLGIMQAIILCLKLKPNVIFSKGGFVSFPVVVAGWVCRVPVLVHESDLTAGLANRMSFPFATKVCVSFPETINQFKNKEKVVITGTPIREDFFRGDASLGRSICGFNTDKKIILVFGGSLGARPINDAVHKLIPEIFEKFQVVHVCGQNKVDLSYNYSGYKQFSYLHEEFMHVLAAADLVISRAGANSIYELISLRKPNILIPLPKTSSRGDQIFNAKYSAERGFSELILQEQLTPELLLQKIKMVEQNSLMFIAAMEKFQRKDSVKIICEMIDEYQRNAYETK